MPYELPLPKRLKARGWKIKIRDKERLEIRELIENNWERLQEAWDRKYPSNPIASKEEDDAKG